MTIFEELRENHDKQRTLADLLIKTEGDSDGRDELFQRLKAELRRHAMAEERHFYVPLMEHDLTQEKSRHSITEHHEIDELVEKLEQTEYESPAWLTTARELQEKVEHHLDEEEHEVFLLAGRVLSDNQKQSLGQSYRQEKSDSR
jgi:hypothetical protein